MARRFVARAGDVFRLPIDAQRVGYGQIITAKPFPYMAFFETAYPADERISADRVVKDRIKFLALTGDELLWHGDWKVIGSVKPDLSRIPFPCFRVAIGASAQDYVESFDGSKRRPAKPAEARALPNKSTFSAIHLQNALQASHGAAEWDHDYERLSYCYMHDLADVCQL